MDHVKGWDKILRWEIKGTLAVWFGCSLDDVVLDLDDVRDAMACLEEIRQMNIELTGEIKVVEEVFGLLDSQKLPVAPEVTRSVDNLR